ncbi:ROK family transcriptional regulator [Bacillus sp. FSL K6-3431]|uniref:ROK family transcriptional regulator n=1 Tax=Bacillus sp. FSL K6-3431 TaxID=2921500 RepID=UPI0030FB7F61
MKISTWNQQLIKIENKTIVLQLVRNKAPLSRADIAQLSGLNKGTVSTLVAELLKEQLILETGPGVSSGGRRPVMLIFNQKAGCAIGIDLGVNYIRGILTDLQGNILLQEQHSYISSSITQTLKYVKANITQLLSQAPSTPYGIVGVGIGVPGIVDNNNDLLLAPNLGWKNSSIKKEIEAEFNIPVIIENEANAGAYGEKMFGLGKDVNDLVYISAGMGIGTGILFNGQLYKGSGGFSGEFGHMTMNINGEKCRCGNIGCWELYASEQYLINKATKLNLITREERYVDQIIELAENNNEKAIALLNEIATHLGMGIVNIVHALNPKKIIVGNILSGAKKWIEESVQNYVKKHAMISLQAEVSIQFSTPSKPSTALGVSAFSVEHFLNSTLGDSE